MKLCIVLAFVMMFSYTSLSYSVSIETVSTVSKQSTKPLVESNLPNAAESQGVLSENIKVQRLQQEVLILKDKIKYLESDVYRAETNYYKKYYEYLGKKSEINLSQFEWQQYASGYLLWLVVIVVLSGVLFSGFQLWKASQINHFGSDSTVELSVQKIKITSSVVGVIVLAISIVFLYFFLIEVYRVKVIDIHDAEIPPPTITDKHINSLQKSSEKVLTNR